jgi:hypothetical protein
MCYSYALCYGTGPTLEVAAEFDHEGRINSVNIAGGLLSLSNLNTGMRIPDKFSQFDGLKSLNNIKHARVNWVHASDDATVMYNRIEKDLRKLALAGHHINLLKVESKEHLLHHSIAGKAFALMKAYPDVTMVGGTQFSDFVLGKVTKLEHE